MFFGGKEHDVFPEKPRRLFVAHIENIEVRGGCDGNLKGVCSLLKGMDAQEAIRRCKGIRCGMRTTSCPDQISMALEEALAQAEKN